MENHILHVDIDRLGNNRYSNHHFKTVYSILQFVIDSALPIILAVALGILTREDFPVNQLGFFCDDTNIRYPYRDSTIPYFDLYFFIILNISIFIFLSALEHNSHRYDRKRLQTLAKAKTLVVKFNCTCRQIEIPYWIWKFAYILYAFIVGYLITMVITLTFKVSVGELRPHFHAVCKADFSQFPCKSMTGYYIYVTNYTCTGSPGLVRSARLSFPSGHSSSITYSMTYLILYLETKLYIPRGIRSMLSLLFALSALLVSLSRLDDFKHHFHDILAGMLIGLLTAAITYFNYLRINVQVERPRRDVNSPHTPMLRQYYKLRDD